MSHSRGKYTLWTCPRSAWTPVLEDLSNAEREEAIAWLNSIDGQRKIEESLDRKDPAYERLLASFNLTPRGGYY